MEGRVIPVWTNQRHPEADETFVCSQPGEESDYLTEYEDEGMDAVREEEGQELLFAPAEQTAVFETVSVFKRCLLSFSS